MKYALRFSWYVLKIVIIAVSAFALLVAAFFVAMDSANVYVIVTDGMKAHAASVLMPNEDSDLQQYFTDACISSLPAIDRTQYESFVITDIDYKITVESLWCNPWRNTATVTVVESIPDMVYSSADATADVDAKTLKKGPQWQRARYKIGCVRIDDVWRINSIKKVENLKAEPTPSPEPSKYITASPLPVSKSPGASATPTPSATK